MSRAFELAREVFKMKFETDLELRKVYQDNIAMVLHDYAGVIDYFKRNDVADKILRHVFEN